MVTQVSRDAIQSLGINEEQISKGEQMTDQAMVGRNFSREGTGHWTSLLDRIAQGYWRVSFEMEPLFRNLFAPFTADIRGSRLLSGKDKAELGALMKKR